jgi:hypothetical protein
LLPGLAGGDAVIAGYAGGLTLVRACRGHDQRCRQSVHADQNPA